MMRMDFGSMTKEKRERMEKALIYGDASLLQDIEEHAEFLEAILVGPYSVMEIDGELKLLHIKALVANVRGLKIEIYPNEHPPPHFHVKSANVDASFAIHDCSLISGEISGFDERKIKYWHGYSKQTLIEKWNAMRPTDCSVGDYKGN